MKNFELTSDMLNMGGVFYPNGYAFIMFPDAAAAEKVAFDIESQPGTTGPVMLLSPATVLKEIGKIEGESDVALPSVGTEGATVRRYVDLARRGNSALMVKLGSDEDAELVMVAARKVTFSYGQRYHLLAMEDLE